MQQQLLLRLLLISMPIVLAAPHFSQFLNTYYVFLFYGADARQIPKPNGPKLTNVKVSALEHLTVTEITTTTTAADLITATIRVYS